MKILFVSESVWQVGVVYDVHVLAEGLSLLGHEVYAIDPGQRIEKSFENSSELFQKTSRALPNARVYLRSATLPYLSPSWRSRFKSHRIINHIERYKILYKELEEILISCKIDIIVLYSAVRLGIQTVRLAKKYRIPVIFRNIDMLHKLWPTRIERLLAKWHERYVYSRVTKLCALTPKYAEYLIHLGAKKSKVSLLLFPINTEMFNSRIDASALKEKWKILSTDKVAVFVGTLYKFGGMLDFLHNVPEFIEQVPNLKILIVGDGPIRHKLEQTIEKLKLKNHVVITGYEPFDLMPHYINLAAICFNIFPINKTTKNIFSAKIVQYLACGKPTVSSALPGITTLIPGQSAGVIYTKSTKELTVKMVGLLQNEEARILLGLSGQNYVKNNHEQNKVISQFEKILEQTLEEASVG